MSRDHTYVSSKGSHMKKPTFIAIALLVVVALVLGGAATSSANPPPSRPT